MCHLTIPYSVTVNKYWGDDRDAIKNKIDHALLFSYYFCVVRKAIRAEMRNKGGLSRPPILVSENIK